MIVIRFRGGETVLLAWQALKYTPNFIAKSSKPYSTIIILPDLSDILLFANSKAVMLLENTATPQYPFDYTWCTLVGEKPSFMVDSYLYIYTTWTGMSFYSLNIFSQVLWTVSDIIEHL